MFHRIEPEFRRILPIHVHAITLTANRFRRRLIRSDTRITHRLETIAQKIAPQRPSFKLLPEQKGRMVARSYVTGLACQGNAWIRRGYCLECILALMKEP